MAPRLLFPDVGVAGIILAVATLNITMLLCVGSHRHTCPAGASPLCQPTNLCTTCHPSCKYCQNLSNNSCGETDCMACHAGSAVRVLYSDGTGPCVPEEEAYVQTCPRGVDGCLPGNKCILCMDMCLFCMSQNGTACGANTCVQCIDGFTLDTDDRGSQTCVVASYGYKRTCPASQRGRLGCLPNNQCRLCPKGCRYCSSTVHTHCRQGDCLQCLPSYSLIHGRCVKTGQSSSTKTPSTQQDQSMSFVVNTAIAMASLAGFQALLQWLQSMIRARAAAAP